MIGGKNYRALFQHPFGMHNAEVEEEVSRDLCERVPEVVGKAHWRGGNEKIEGLEWKPTPMKADLEFVFMGDF